MSLVAADVGVSLHHRLLIPTHISTQWQSYRWIRPCQRGHAGDVGLQVRGVDPLFVEGVVSKPARLRAFGEADGAVSRAVPVGGHNLPRLQELLRPVGIVVCHVSNYLQGRYKIIDLFTCKQTDKPNCCQLTSCMGRPSGAYSLRPHCMAKEAKMSDLPRLR